MKSTMLPVLLRIFTVMMNEIKKIPYIDLRAQWQLERNDLMPIIESVLNSGSYINGDQVVDLEQKIASYCGAKYCVTLNSGTDALMTGLLALGVQAGDEVITPPNSFVASTAAIMHIGAKPVFVDVLNDQLMDTSRLEAAITSRTKAIMPVHLTGKMVNMPFVCEIAKKYNLKVIEDSAQSIGSRLNGVPSGMYGDIGCFSTHPLKNLNACGDGGFIITNSKKISDKISLYRNHGFVERNLVEHFGVVSRMDEIQAAILKYRINNLDTVIKKRRINAAAYRDLLNSEFVYIPEEKKGEFNSYHTFVIQTSHRDALSEFLREEGINTAVHYPRLIHLQPAAKKLKHSPGDFPVAEDQAKKILSLPIYQNLKYSDISRVATTVNAYLKNKMI